MDAIRTLFSRIVALFQRRRFDARLDEELRTHIAFAEEENLRRGMGAAEAHTAAMRAFGGLTQTRERYRIQRGAAFAESIVQDARFALRQLRYAPGFAITAALILTLGIGINTAIFSVVAHILLEPLPFPQSNQLYAVSARSDIQGNARILASGPDFLDYHDQNHSFAQMAEMLGYFTETWTGAGEPKLLECTGISDDFFAMLGIHPFLGRFYTTAEYADLHSPSLVISYRFWKSQLGGDPHVLGRTLTIGGAENVIVGVTPPLPDLYPETDLWPELTTRPSWPFMQWRSNKFLTVIGRLKSGVAPAAAAAELTGILRHAPGEPSDVRVQLSPLKDDLVGSVRTQLRFLVLAVAVVLLVACLNIAGLLLARAARRSGEMALRLSLGAGHRRLRRQLLVEGSVLVALALLPGVTMAWLSLRMLPHLPSMNLPRLDGIHLNVAAFASTCAIAVLATLFFGWAPSLGFSSLNLAGCLRSERAGTGKPQHRTLSALIVIEIACSLVLSVCAGLLLHSYWRLAHVDAGFEPDHMLVTYLRTNYYSPEGRPFWAGVLQGVETIPGVRGAALGDCIPGQSAAAATLVFGDRSNDPTHPAPAKGCWISSGFFGVAGTPLLRGRFFNSGDNADAALVAVVNEQAARAYWPGQNPIGKLIGVNYTGPGRVGKTAPAMRRIVGVVQGIKHAGPEAPTEPAVYMPYLQDETFHDMATMHLFVRSTESPALLENAIRTRIHAVRADQPVETIATMDDMISQANAPRRYSLSLLAAFATLTLLLAAVGIYGIVSYTTQQRTSEFGIRIAVGAARGHVMALVFRHGLRLAGAGCAIGFVLALVAARALERLLFEIGPFDGASFTAAVVVLGLVAGAACALPALRAARVDPVRALRHP